MMKGIWFNNIHSYDDLNLVLSKPDIPPAKPKTNYIDIPGADGSIDLTEATGEVKFEDRDCTFTFTVFPYDDFEEKKKEVSNLLNGRCFRIVLDKDPDYYWTGRCSIDQYASDKNVHKIVVKARVSPYKMKVDPTKVVVPRGESVVKLWNGRKTVIPTFTFLSGYCTVAFNGNTYTVYNTEKNPSIQLVEGLNEMTITNTGSETIITYQEGDL